MLKVVAKISIALSLLLCAGAYPVFVSSDPPEELELADNWTLSPAKGLVGNGASVSVGSDDRLGVVPNPSHARNRAGNTSRNGVYPDLYMGKNLRDQVPQEVYRPKWWYRTTFTAPEGRTAYLFGFPGINYRGEIWLNGHLVANGKQIVGMYAAHELNVTPWVHPGQPNTLAVKVTPERGG